MPALIAVGMPGEEEELGEGRVAVLPGAGLGEQARAVEPAVARSHVVEHAVEHQALARLVEVAAEGRQVLRGAEARVDGMVIPGVVAVVHAGQEDGGEVQGADAEVQQVGQALAQAGQVAAHEGLAAAAGGSRAGRCPTPVGPGWRPPTGAGRPGRRAARAAVLVVVAGEAVGHDLVEGGAGQPGGGRVLEVHEVGLVVGLVGGQTQLVEMPEGAAAVFQHETVGQAIALEHHRGLPALPGPFLHPPHLAVLGLAVGVDSAATPRARPRGGAPGKPPANADGHHAARRQRNARCRRCTAGAGHGRSFRKQRPAPVRPALPQPGPRTGLDRTRRLPQPGHVRLVRCGLNSANTRLW